MSTQLQRTIERWGYPVVVTGLAAAIFYFPDRLTVLTAVFFVIAVVIGTVTGMATICLCAYIFTLEDDRQIPMFQILGIVGWISGLSWILAYRIVSIV